MELEWDPAKAASNLKKHKVSFEEAATVFDDPLSITVPDPDQSGEEDRYLTEGMSDRGRLLIAAHTILPAAGRSISSLVREWIGKHVDLPRGAGNQ